jgi:hypothetical protein
LSCTAPGVGAQRRRLVDIDQSLAGEERRLRPHVDETMYTNIGARCQRVTRALHVAALEGIALAPIADHRRSTERELAANRSGPHRVDV